jgi:hypothetical protein
MPPKCRSRKPLVVAARSASWPRCRRRQCVFEPQIKRLSLDYDVDDSGQRGRGRPGPRSVSVFRFSPLRIERKISVGRDLATFFHLWRFFRAQRFDVVHSFMPKAGLLAMMAAKAAGIPFRLHTFTGQVWATQRGLKKALLKALDGLMPFAQQGSLQTAIPSANSSLSRTLWRLADWCPGRRLSGGRRYEPLQRRQGARLALRSQLQIPERR